VKIPEFDATLEKFDKNGDKKISLAESPDEMTKKYFPYIDLNGDGVMDAAEWKMYAATLSAENGLLSVKLGGHGDVTGTHVTWKFQRSIPQLPSVLIYRDVLYMINDSGVLTTINPSTGALYKQARLRGVSESFYSSPVASDGKVFFLSRSGVLTVVEAGPDQKVLAVNELNEESVATPAVSSGRLYVRTSQALYCFANR
jgi:outer membrane protein assembly factor BamB